MRTHEALDRLGAGHPDRPGASSSGWNPAQPARAATAAATGLPGGATDYPLPPGWPRPGSSVSSSPRAPSPACLRGGGSVAAGPPPDPAALPPLEPRWETGRLQSGHPEGGRPQSRPGGASGDGEAPPRPEQAGHAPPPRRGRAGGGGRDARGSG